MEDKRLEISKKIYEIRKEIREMSKRIHELLLETDSYLAYLDGGIKKE